MVRSSVGERVLPCVRFYLFPLKFSRSAHKQATGRKIFPRTTRNLIHPVPPVHPPLSPAAPLSCTALGARLATLVVCSVSSRTNYPRPLHPPTIVGRRSNERAKTIRVSTPRLRSIGPEPPLGQRATGAADRHPRPRPAGARPRGADRRHRALARPEPHDPLGSVATVSTAGNRRDRR